MKQHNFDPDLVTITRKRFSVTQGETLVEYNGERLEQYGDEPSMIDGMQKPKTFWIEVARRETAKRGWTYHSAPIGSTLENGRTVIACANGYVLALLEGSCTPYAIWGFDCYGGTYQGDYHTSIIDAVAAFTKRAGI